MRKIIVTLGLALSMFSSVCWAGFKDFSEPVQLGKEVTKVQYQLGPRSKLTFTFQGYSYNGAAYECKGLTVASGKECYELTGWQDDDKSGYYELREVTTDDNSGKFYLVMKQGQPNIAGEVWLFGERHGKISPLLTPADFAQASGGAQVMLTDSARNYAVVLPDGRLEVGVYAKGAQKKLVSYAVKWVDGSQVASVVRI